MDTDTIAFHNIDPQTITELQPGIFEAIHPTTLDLNQALVEVAELPFYEDYLLYAITDLRLPTGVVYELLCGPGGAFFLDVGNKSIYHVNKLAPVRLNADTLIPYLRFFCRYAAKANDSIRLVESVEDIPWRPDANQAIITEAAAKLVPLTLKEVHQDDFCRVNATMLVRDELLLLDILIPPCALEAEANLLEEAKTLAPGEMRLHASKLLMASLPVETIEGENEIDAPENDEEEPPSAFALYASFPSSAGFDFHERPAAFAAQVVAAMPEDIRPKAASTEGFRLKTCELPFYPDFCLCALRDPAVTPPNVRFFLCLRDFTGRFVPMDKSNEPIYTLNSEKTFHLTLETMPSYTHFCFFLIQGRMGRFNIVERPEYVRWQPCASDKHKQAVNELLMPITYTGLDTAGLHTLKATVVHHNNLFRAEVKIAPQPMVVLDPATNQKERYSLGQMLLAQTEVLLENLPVVVD